LANSHAQDCSSSSMSPLHPKPWPSPLRLPQSRHQQIGRARAAIAQSRFLQYSEMIVGRLRRPVGAYVFRSRLELLKKLVMGVYTWIRVFKKISYNAQGCAVICEGKSGVSRRVSRLQMRRWESSVGPCFSPPCLELDPVRPQRRQRLDPCHAQPRQPCSKCDEHLASRPFAPPFVAP